MDDSVYEYEKAIIDDLKQEDVSRYVDVDEETYTLLNFDVVNLDGPVQEELRESIEKEGIIIYEKI